MSSFLWIAAELLACGFTLRYGDRTLRLVGAWVLTNCLLHAALTFGRVLSPTLHLLDDGIYATGLLPLAFFTVSPWVGALALLACGAFVMQSAYLLGDRPTDWTFVALNNLLTVVVLITLVLGTRSAMRRRTRPAPQAQYIAT